VGSWLRTHTAIVYLYLYFPIAVLVAFSFNAQRLNLRWTGFTLDWYGALWRDGNLQLAAANSLLVALVAAAISTVAGTLAALALERHAPRGRLVVESLLYLAIIVPDVVLGIALLALFAGLGVQTGLATVIVSHVVLCLPFVTLTVRARLAGGDRVAEEAAMDLGARPAVAFWRVTLPALLPGVLSGALLAFTLSLDDYVVAYFTSGPGATTLPLRIFAMVRFGITPEINALATLWVLGAFAVLLVGQFLERSPADAPKR
jgi:spermidine/putrescine transport system permease protein